MAVSNKLFIGIDIDYERALISLYMEGMDRVQTVSTVSGQERFQIPTSIFLTNQGKFYYGEEAVKRQNRPDGEFFTELLRESLDENNVIYRNMMVQFIRRLMKFGEKYETPETEIMLAITVPEIGVEMVEFFDYARRELELKEEQFILMDYSESFFAHTFQQDPALRLHDVALFDFRGNQIVYRLMHTNGAGRVKRILCDKQTWEVPKYLLDNPSGKDEFMANIIREVFFKQIISTVYFIGDGFDGNWLWESLRVIGQNKRVFKGKNLYSLGACMVAHRIATDEVFQYYFDSDYKLQGEVSMVVQVGEQKGLQRLISPGVNWFDPTPVCYLLYDGDAQIQVQVRTRERLNARVETFPLDFLSERPVKSVRLKVQAVPVSGYEVILRIEDDGFGELFEKSGKVWEFPISFTEKSAKK